MEAMDVRRVEGWIEGQLKERWPDARSLGHENRDGNLYFSVRYDYTDLWLIIGPRARRTLAADELTELLDEEH